MDPLHTDGRVERLARLGLHRHLARAPKGGAARLEDVVEEITIMGASPEEAVRALDVLAERGEIYLSGAGWRARAVPPNPRSPLAAHP